MKNSAGICLTLSQHWFTYSRDEEHVASADEIMVDYSLMEVPAKTPIAQRVQAGVFGVVFTRYIFSFQPTVPELILN